jgi:hypothetical protein
MLVLNKDALFHLNNGKVRFCILIDYRGCHRKGIEIYHATYVNLQQKPLVSLNNERIFEHYQEVQTR